MRILTNCCALFTLVSFAEAAYPHNHPSLPAFYQQSSPSRTRSVFSRLRDGLIRSIWSIPSYAAERGATNIKFDSTLLARYGGDVVLRFAINSPEEAAALSEAVHILFLDVWEFNADWVDIRLAKDVVPSLLGLLPPSLQHAHTPLMHDLAQAIFESYPSLTIEDPSPPARDEIRPFSPVLHTIPDTDETNIFFRNYQPLSVIIPWMRLLRSLFPTHVRMINVGVSYEGRDIPALRVGVHPSNAAETPSSPRKTIIITGGSHAREWISTSTVNYIAYSFITAYGKSKEITRLLEEFDWVFVPTMNPDGYIYTWETDRLWRKNRQQTSLRFCRGVDLDHSYSFKWDHDSSASNNPCSESFAGEGPFQGVEARRFANWARNETANNNVTIVAFVDLHSYSQQILYPYSYTCSKAPPALENLEELAIGLAKAIRTTKGEEYTVTAACEGSVELRDQQDKRFWPRIESGGGSALDWFYHELNVKYSYQIKLRDTGGYGFLLPSKNIVPTGLEAFNAIKYMGHFLLGNKGIEGEEESRDASAALGPEMQGDDDEINEEANIELRRRRRK
ncbi:MAG: hypothetical protein Q9192_002880 [Flavoplaca navasiana]